MPCRSFPVSNRLPESYCNTEVSAAIIGARQDSGISVPQTLVMAAPTTSTCLHRAPLAHLLPQPFQNTGVLEQRSTSFSQRLLQPPQPNVARYGRRLIHSATRPFESHIERSGNVRNISPPQSQPYQGEDYPSFRQKNRSLTGRVMGRTPNTSGVPTRGNRFLLSSGPLRPGVNDCAPVVQSTTLPLHLLQRTANDTNLPRLPLYASQRCC